MKNVTFEQLVLKHVTLKKDLQPISFFGNWFDQIAPSFFYKWERQEAKKKKRQHSNLLIKNDITYNNNISCKFKCQIWHEVKFSRNFNIVICLFSKLVIRKIKASEKRGKIVGKVGAIKYLKLLHFVFDGVDIENKIKHHFIIYAPVSCSLCF